MKHITSLLVILALSLTSCMSGRSYIKREGSDLPFSSAVRAGNLVFISGHIGTDPESGEPPAKLEDEINRMLDRFEASITGAGMTWDHLVRVKVYCSDLTLYGAFNDLYRKRFTKGNFPTRAFIGSGPLLRGCKFEISGICAD